MNVPWSWAAAPAIGAAPARSGDDLARADLGTAAFLLVLAGWLAYLVLWERFGRSERVRSAADGEAPLLELPDDHPAVVDVLRRNGAARPATLGTVVLDLARRGYLEIEEQQPPTPEPSGGHWVFHRQEMPRGELRPYENAVYTRLFASGNTTTHDELVAWVQANRQQARVWIERVGRLVAGELSSKGYVERGRRLPVLLNLLAAGLVAVVGLAALVQGAWWGVAAVASGAYQGSLSGRLRRRTTAGSARAREWATAADVLARVDEAQRKGRRRVDWERLLVQAVVLGVDDAFRAALGRREGATPGPGELASWYRSPAPDAERLTALGTFPERFGRSLAGAAEGAEESASGALGVGRFSAWASRSR